MGKYVRALALAALLLFIRPGDISAQFRDTLAFATTFDFPGVGQDELVAVSGQWAERKCVNNRRHLYGYMIDTRSVDIRFTEQYLGDLSHQWLSVPSDWAYAKVWGFTDHPDQDIILPPDRAYSRYSVFVYCDIFIACVNQKICMVMTNIDFSYYSPVYFPIHPLPTNNFAARGRRVRKYSDEARMFMRRLYDSYVEDFKTYMEDALQGPPIELKEGR